MPFTDNPNVIRNDPRFRPLDGRPVIITYGVGRKIGLAHASCIHPWKVATPVTDPDFSTDETCVECNTRF